MANNRIFIRCTTCGAKRSIAKFYPSAGWYAHSMNASGVLSNFFTAHVECAPEEYDRNYGPQNFAFEYEEEREEAKT